MQIEPRSFRRLNRTDKVRQLVSEGLLTEAQGEQLLAEVPVLPLELAEQMIENVIGVFGMPLAVVPNVVVNDRGYDVPMVIEEPSVIAAQSHAAKLVRESGGYRAGVAEQWMIAQIQVVGLKDAASARAALAERETELIETANGAIGGLVRRGGGMQGVEYRILHHRDDARPMLVVHLLADTLDAMGANAMNSAAEACAELVEEITGGKVVLRILSNLADRRRAWAEARIRTELLGVGETPGPEVAENLVAASKLAEIDPYRAATHNKGAMNGVDAVVLATGNDFRAVEAGAHAWAARDGIYRALSSWRVEDDRLVGRIELPLALGIVGGQTKTHPWVAPLLALTGVTRASELSQLVAAVGLGQNFAAMRALASEGIQAGHMAMHARAVALEVGARPAEVPEVVDAMKRRGDITREAAQTILAELRQGGA